MQTNLQQDFLSLVRLGIGNTQRKIAQSLDWQSINTIVQQQGLTAIFVDGIEQLPDNIRPPRIDLLAMIGSAMKEEALYTGRWEASKKLASLFANYGIRTYVLKGAIVAECYPKPSHRFSIDLDCFLLPKDGKEDVWEKGNRIVEKVGFVVKRDYYKNSTFLLPNLTVENHRFLLPFRGNKRLTRLEYLLQELLKEDRGYSKFEDSDLYKPPVMVSALFLIEHAYSHFLHEGLNWRHVLDWMMFSKKHEVEIDWQQMDKWIGEFGLRYFYDSFYHLGRYLLGEINENDLSNRDMLMLRDVWAPLDLHETVDGVKGKLALVGNTWRARWKYREFTDMSWLQALWILVKGYLFIKEPIL